MKFMFDSFEEYAAIMKITPDHPYWEAFKIVWDMARSPAFAEEEEENEISKS